MSYLPRMSKTYKEPEERTAEEPTKEIIFNSIPIASAHLDKKSYNPQTMLKQYSYYPHPPPVLPGPSLLQEVEKNEKNAAEAKRRRSTEGNQIIKNKTNSTEDFPFSAEEKPKTVNYALLEVKPQSVEQQLTMSHTTKKSFKSTKTPRKGPAKVNKIKEEPIKEEIPSEVKDIVEAESVTPQSPKKEASCIEVETPNNEHESDVPKAIADGLDKHSPNKVKTIKSDEDPEPDDSKPHIAYSNPTVKSSVHQGVQMTPRSGSGKSKVVPSSIIHMMKTLSFLVHELENEGKQEVTKEVKKLIGQIDEGIESISDYKIDRSIVMLTSLSDWKRLEKIYGDIEKYLEDIYGVQGKLGSKSEEKKELYCKLIQKEYELHVLNEKLRESDIQNPSPRQLDVISKAPEVVLQNKNLENEQLRAEVEFSTQEMRKFHEILAEKNWEIFNYKEEISSLKKKLAKLRTKAKN